MYAFSITYFKSSLCYCQKRMSLRTNKLKIRSQPVMLLGCDEALEGGVGGNLSPGGSYLAEILLVPLPFFFYSWLWGELAFSVIPFLHDVLANPSLQTTVNQLCIRTSKTIILSTAFLCLLFQMFCYSNRELIFMLSMFLAFKYTVCIFLEAGENI